MVLFRYLMKAHNWKLSAGSVPRNALRIIHIVWKHTDPKDILCFQEVGLCREFLSIILNRVAADRRWAASSDAADCCGALVILGRSDFLMAVG